MLVPILEPLKISLNPPPNRTRVESGMVVYDVVSVSC